MITKREAFAVHDLDNFPEDGKIREVIGGELCVTAAPSPRHQRIVMELVGRIWLYLREDPEGVVLPAPVEVALADEDVVQPNIVFVRKPKAEMIREKRVVGAPDWLVEVLSPATRERDLYTRRNLYARYGVVYWVVDPESKEISTWHEGGFARHSTGVATVSVLSGFELNVEDVFAAVP